MSYVPQRPARSEQLPLRQLNVHVNCWGQPAPGSVPLVLVHGWMDVGASYQFMVDALSADFADRRLIIAPDWRGFGQTTLAAPCDHYVFADYLGDLDALIDHYAPDGQPVDLLGHSMGGNVVMQYAGARPTRIRRLVNLEGFGMPASRPAQAPRRLTQWLDELKQLRQGEISLKTYPDADAVARRLTKTNPRLPADKAAWLARQWARPGADGQWRILGDAAHKIVNPSLFRVDEMLALYAAITAPVLVIEGSDDSLSQWWKGRYSLDEFHERLKAVPVLSRQVLPDSGHMLHHDQPERLARALEAFLDAP
ncbi:MAG TPA: alpha/beta hydrolase [Ottowia sp.]|nr:alpha/beta hydrolase [Ottowia sp.]HON31752.1 alpha/beta hydrolase [Ottowia sp.]HQX68248.1 alpha/beta hydrolase [Ottowia sp.]HRB10632.1 alpha/beta hydrolase [Ottowia sp.]